MGGSPFGAIQHVVTVDQLTRAINLTPPRAFLRHQGGNLYGIYALTYIPIILVNTLSIICANYANPVLTLNCELVHSYLLHLNSEKTCQLSSHCDNNCHALACREDMDYQ